MTRIEAIEWAFTTHMALDCEMCNTEDEKNAKEVAEAFNALNVTKAEFEQIDPSPYSGVHALVLAQLLAE